VSASETVKAIAYKAAYRTARSPQALHDHDVGIGATFSPVLEPTGRHRQSRLAPQRRAPQFDTLLTGVHRAKQRGPSIPRGSPSVFQKRSMPLLISRYNDSSVASAAYLITTAVAPPTFSLSAGQYSTAQPYHSTRILPEQRFGIRPMEALRVRRVARSIAARSR